MSDGFDQDADSALLTGKKTKPSTNKNIEWGKFGLSEDKPAGDGTALAGDGDGYQTGAGGEKIQELYDEQQVRSFSIFYFQTNFSIFFPQTHFSQFV